MDKCKYKKYSNERVCSPLDGECQFITCGYGEQCPIFQMLEAYGYDPSPDIDPDAEQYDVITIEDGGQVTAEVLCIVSN